MHIQGSVFLITGGASGLGLGAARRLSEAGARIVIADIDPAGEAAAADLAGGARFARTDVADEASGSAAIELALGAFGRLDGLVNCAGVAQSARVVGREGPHPLELFERTVRANLTGTFNMVRLAAEAMSRIGPGPDGVRGVIVNTASIAACDGQIGQAAYAASKAGVAGMTLPLARDLARHGIRVVAIAPGIFETPMLASVSDEFRAALGASVPFPQRLGRPDEYAALVQHIVENDMLNGEVIRLDGALRMPPR